ncbi:MAG TPA: hypothetical protein VG870_03780 [Chitinophagaceae bacterium]|nr:hypothetical protein [Chitinophagaceae bacterium]
MRYRLPGLRTTCCLPLIILSTLMTRTWSQDVNPLNFRSAALNLHVAGQGSLAICTRAGEVALTNRPDSSWYRADPVSGEMQLHPLFDHVTFFNKDTGFASGFFPGPDGRYNFLYRTTDAGRHWDTVHMNQEGWVDDVRDLSSGEAWISVGGSGLAYTADYGRSWTAFNNPENRQRFAQIFFNARHEGLIGSLWNLLAYTPDNGRTWRMLPTPLDQKRYRKTNPAARPEINRVAIFGSHFLVVQEDLVFCSAKDSVQWTWLPDFRDLYTDPQDSLVYFITRGGSIVCTGKDLQPRFRVDSAGFYYTACARNGNLYLLGSRSIRVIRADRRVEWYPIGTDVSATADFDPEPFGYGLAGTYGRRENQIFVQSYDHPAWVYLCSLPNSLAKAPYTLVQDNRILVEKGSDSLLYYSRAGILVQALSRKKMLADFAAPGIRNIIFARGSQGCFHRYQDSIVFEFGDGAYLGGEIASEGSDHALLLPEAPGIIRAAAVRTFLEDVPGLFDSARFATIADLGITEKDLEECKKEIREFRTRIESGKKPAEKGFYLGENNLDFPRLERLADSIKNIPTRQLTQWLLAGNGFFSTTTNWTSLTLVNQAGRRLTLTCPYFEERPAYYAAWIVEAEGYRFRTTHAGIARFIDQVYPGLLDHAGKQELLNRLVAGLYSAR